MKNDRVYVQHILDSIAKIRIYCEGKNYDEFAKDNMLIHQYFGVDTKIVWHTVEHDIDILEAMLIKV